jgi:hypothetical protein
MSVSLGECRRKFGRDPDSENTPVSASLILRRSTRLQQLPAGRPLVVHPCINNTHTARQNNDPFCEYCIFRRVFIVPILYTDPSYKPRCCSRVSSAEFRRCR